MFDLSVFLNIGNTNLKIGHVRVEFFLVIWVRAPLVPRNMSTKMGNGITYT